MLWDTVTPNSDQLIPRAKCDRLHRKRRFPHFLSFLRAKKKRKEKENKQRRKQKTISQATPLIGDAGSQDNGNKRKSALFWLRGTSCACLLTVSQKQPEHQWASTSLELICWLCVCVCPWTCGWLCVCVGGGITALRASDEIQINAGTKCPGKHSVFCNYFAGRERSPTQSGSQC